MTQQPGRVSEGEIGRYPWVAMAVVLSGAFVVILDTTILNVVLPGIDRELDGTVGIEWVVTGYLIAVGIAQLASGWLSDRFGKKFVFASSLGAFTVGSLMAALAPSMPTLVAFRVIQGIGGGAMMPVGLAMVYELFPPDRRGSALGIWGISALAAPALGPVAGGWIATNASWRWVFALNVPIGLLGVILARRLLRDVGTRRHRRLDWTALLLASSGLTLLLIAFDKTPEWGWSSPLSIGLACSGLLAAVLFVARELRSGEPLLDLGMFRERTFSITIILLWLMTIAQYARLVLIPIELQLVHGMTPFETGLLLAPAAASTAVGMILGGRLSDRIGARVPVSIGLTTIALALWLTGSIAPDTPPAHIMAYLILQGAGTGLALVPNTVIGMNALASHFISSATAVRAVNRQVAAAFGVSMLASLVTSRLGTLTGSVGVSIQTMQNAYNSAFRLAFAGIVGAVLLSLLLPGASGARRIQADRFDEFQEYKTT